MKEYILCSAIWYKELPLVNPELLQIRGFAPYNVDKGIVFCGWRHPNCLYAKNALTGLRDAESGDYIQGFLTNLNRFVDRKEAASIAYKAGQVNDRVRWYEMTDEDWKNRELYSEDIY